MRKEGGCVKGGGEVGWWDAKRREAEAEVEQRIQIYIKNQTCRAKCPHSARAQTNTRRNKEVSQCVLIIITQLYRMWTFVKQISWISSPNRKHTKAFTYGWALSTPKSALLFQTLRCEHFRCKSTPLFRIRRESVLPGAAGQLLKLFWEEADACGLEFSCASTAESWKIPAEGGSIRVTCFEPHATWKLYCAAEGAWPKVAWLSFPIFICKLWKALFFSHTQKNSHQQQLSRGGWSSKLSHPLRDIAK